MSKNCYNVRVLPCMVFSLVLALVISLSYLLVYKVGSTYVYADTGELEQIEVDVVYTELNFVDVITEVPIYIEEEVIKEVDAVNMSYKGNFKLTAYCPCTICCNQYGAGPEGKTGAMGVGVYEGISFAVDPTVIPYGSKMYIEGIGAGIAVDCGGAIKENRIDVYYPDHQMALSSPAASGYYDVYIIDDVLE